MNKLEHDGTILEFQRASWDLQEDRHAITSIECTNAGIVLAEPLKLEELYRTVEAVCGTEPFRTLPIPTISTGEHDLLMKRGFMEHDQLWKELAGM